MTADERLAAYLASLDTPEDAFLTDIEEKARMDGVPIIRQSMKSFLHTYIELVQPNQILEVGAAVGYSAMLMASYAPENCHITTIEYMEERIKQAKSNLASGPYAQRISLLEGDAAEILPKLSGPYDLIFMDAAKAQYIRLLPDVVRLLREGGVLITDNVLQEGDILESRYAVRRRDRTIYKRMREYLYALKHHEALVTSVIPLADGAAVSIKRTR